MKKFILLTLILSVVLIFTSCNNDVRETKAGDYRFLVYKKDSTVVKVWSAYPNEQVINIQPSGVGEAFYYLPIGDINKVEYVGLHDSNDIKQN